MRIVNEQAYQYGPEKDTIEICMAEGSGETRWIVFKKRQHSEMAPESFGGGKGEL